MAHAAENNPGGHYSPNDADCDAGNLATLLDIIVTELCDLSRDGIDGTQKLKLTNLDALTWVCRDTARRLSAGVHAAIRAA